MHGFQPTVTDEFASAGSRPLVLVVDDHRLCRETLAISLATPGCCLRVRTAGSDLSLIHRCLGPEPNAVLLLSCCSEAARPLALLGAVRARNRRVRFIVMTDPNDETFLRCAGHLAIDAVLTSAADAATVVRAVAAAPAPVRSISQYWPQPRPLTPRESQIVRYVVAGLRNVQIARKIGIAEKTVKVNLTNVYGKLGIRGRAELTALAPRLIPLPDQRQLVHA